MLKVQLLGFMIVRTYFLLYTKLIDALTVYTSKILLCMLIQLQACHFEPWILGLSRLVRLINFCFPANLSVHEEKIKQQMKSKVVVLCALYLSTL